jgi:hypothetical protein
MLRNMIPESDPNARKIVQAVMHRDERLVWAGRPRLRLVMFSEAPMFALEVGLIGLFLSVVGFFHLDPAMGWKYQYSPDLQQTASVFCGVLSLVCLLSWPIVSYAIVWAEGVYGTTTMRVLAINRKRRQVLVRELCSVSAVSIISNQDGHGSVIIESDDSDSLTFNYLECVSTIAKAIAENFSISFDEITSNPTVATKTVSRFEEIAMCLYEPVSKKTELIAVIASIALWLAYLFLIWVWLGSIMSYIGQSWLLYIGLIFFTVLVTKGLLLQLKACGSN